MIRKLKPHPYKFKVGDSVVFNEEAWKKVNMSSGGVFTVRVTGIYRGTFRGKVITSNNLRCFVGEDRDYLGYEYFELV